MNKEKSKTRVAVVGVGYLGEIHARIYNDMENVDLIGVVDTEIKTARSIAEKYNCTVYTEINDLIGKIDAVSIVVPTSRHLEVSRPFLQSGIHTMLEKPVAPTVRESAEIVDIANKSSAILQIGHLERFNAGVMKLAELSKQPRFIEVHRLGEFVDRGTDVDVVTDLMIHDIDIVLSLIKSKIKSISATGTPVVTGRVDIANARLEFENKAVANVTASRVSQNQFRRIRVFSQNSYLGLNFADQQIEEIKTGAIRKGNKFPDIQYNQIEVTPQLPLNAELSHFIHCVNENKRPMVSGEDGLIAVEVAEMVRGKIADSMI